MGNKERDLALSREAQDIIALPELANVYAIALANILSRGGTIPQGWMRPLSVYRLFPTIGNTGTHMMTWDDSGHHLQLDALKRFGLATTDSRDTGDHHPGLNLAGGLIGSVLLKPDLRAVSHRSIDTRIRSLLDLSHTNLEIFTVGAVQRIGSVNSSVVQRFHVTMESQLKKALESR